MTMKKYGMVEDPKKNPKIQALKAKWKKDPETSWFYTCTAKQKEHCYYYRLRKNRLSMYDRAVRLSMFDVLLNSAILHTLLIKFIITR